MENLMGCCIGTICCQFNCIIFPAPTNAIYEDFTGQKVSSNRYGNAYAEVSLQRFKNQAEQSVPFMKISNERSRKNKEIIIYFHGNAQDIFYCVDFVLPIFKATEITILCLQYPTYSLYKETPTYFISDRIKENSLEFYDHVLKNFGVLPQDIYIFGRSIGTGPATYLAARKQCKKLALVSPFDSIKKVSQRLVGCSGRLIKNHFDNQTEIKNFRGQLLVIHGKIDEVIHFEHGYNLVQTYEESHRLKCNFIQPSTMSHNIFDIINDIVQPTKAFFLNQNITHYQDRI